MNQRTFLGLTHNPFTPPREGFFKGGDRKTHLEHLRHLSQWSRRILVVTGPFGIGKSSLFRELSGSLEPNTKAARLSGTIVASEREALVGLLQGFGIGADLDAHAEDLADVIMRYVSDQEALGRVCMVMLDDAHLVDQQTIERLVRMVGLSPLRLLLFAEASLITELNKIVNKNELEWFEIRLTGFPKTDVRDYLEWRFGQAHYRGRLPFTDEQLDKIVNRSSGNPSVVDTMSNRLLADMESGEIRKAGGGFPVAHAALAVVLVVFIGLVYLFVQDDPFASLDVNQSPAVAVEVLQTDTVDEPQEAAPGTVDDLVSDASAAREQDRAADTIESGVSLASNEGDQSEIVDWVAASVLAPVAISDSALEPVLEPEPELKPEVEIAPEADSLSGPQIARPSVALPEREELTEPEVLPEPEVVPEREVVSKPAPLKNERFKSAQWLLQQDGARFTMQLLTVSSRERASAFINRQSNPEEFALYRIQRDGRTLYVVTYGIFSGKPGAQSAVNSFTGELAGMKPWVRALALVQDTIRNNPQ